MKYFKQQNTPQLRDKVNIGKYRKTKGRDDEIHQETLQETLNGGSIFQPNLEQPRETW